MPLRWTRGLKQPTLAHSSAFYRQLQLSWRVNLCLLTICCCCCHMGRQVGHQVPQRVSRVYESLGMPWMTIYEITFSGILSVVLGRAHQGWDSLLESGDGTLWLQSVFLFVLLVTRSLRKAARNVALFYRSSSDEIMVRLRLKTEGKRSRVEPRPYSHDGDVS